MPASLVPRTDDGDVYLVLDELKKGRVWREIDEELANEYAIAELIIEGEFNHPVRVVAFNTAGSWSRDVTEDIARKLLDFSSQGRILGTAAREFVERITGQAPNAIV